MEARAAPGHFPIRLTLTQEGIAPGRSGPSCPARRKKGKRKGKRNEKEKKREIEIWKRNPKGKESGRHGTQAVQQRRPGPHGPPPPPGAAERCGTGPGRAEPSRAEPPRTTPGFQHRSRHGSPPSPSSWPPPACSACCRPPCPPRARATSAADRRGALGSQAPPRAPAPPRGRGAAAFLRPAPLSARPASPAAGREWRPDPPRAPARGPPTADGCGVAVPRTRRRVAPPPERAARDAPLRPALPAQHRPARAPEAALGPARPAGTARRRCGESRSFPRAAHHLGVPGAFPARQCVPRRREGTAGPGTTTPSVPRGADIRFPACPAPCRRCVRDAAVLAEQRRSPSGRVAPPAQRR